MWSVEHPVDWSGTKVLANPHNLTTRTLQEAISIRHRDNGALPSEYVYLVRLSDSPWLHPLIICTCLARHVNTPHCVFFFGATFDLVCLINPFVTLASILNIRRYVNRLLCGTQERQRSLPSAFMDSAIKQAYSFLWWLNGMDGWTMNIKFCGISLDRDSCWSHKFRNKKKLDIPSQSENSQNNFIG